MHQSGTRGRHTYEFKSGKQNQWHAYHVNNDIHLVMVIGTILQASQIVSVSFQKSQVGQFEMLRVVLRR